MNKVLIISYYFPPMGMGGVQRTLKFAKYLKDYGWQPYVLTDSPKKYYAFDDFLLQEARDAGIIIERTGKGIISSHKVITKIPKEGFRKLKSKIAQVFFIPDSKILWKKKALKKIDEIWKKHNGFDLVFATAPPYTDFLIGQDVKKKYKIPLVIDYRDAWVDSNVLNYYPTPYHKNSNMNKERKVIKDSNIVIVTNRRVKEMIITRYNNIEYNDVKIFPHGFDQADFDYAKTRKLPLTNKMRVTYSGSFYTRNPKFYFDAIKLFFKRYPMLKDKVEFCFIGHFAKEHNKLAKQFKILEYINATGYLNHMECIKYILSSDVLFLMISRGENDDAAMPGKMGEYIGSRKNILACIPEGVTKKVLEKYNAIKFVDTENPSEIADKIFEYYKLFEMNKMPVPEEDMVVQYDRKLMTSELSKEFNYLLDIE